MRQTLTGQITELKAAHALELSELQKQEQQKREEEVSALQTALQQSEEQRQKELAETRQELEQRRLTELNALKEELTLEIQLRDEELQSIRTKAENESSELKSRIEALNRSGEERIRALTEDFEAAIKRANSEHAIEVENLKKKQAEENAALQTARQKELAELAEKHSREITDLQAEHKRFVDSLVEEHRKAVEQLKQEAAEKAEAAAIEKQRIEEAHRSLVEGLQNEIRHRDEQIQQQKDRVSKLQESNESILQTLEQEREEFQKQRNHLNERIARIEEESLLVSEELNATIREREASLQTAEQLLAEASQRIDSLEEQKREHLARIDGLEKELQQSQSRIVELDRFLEREKEERRTERERLLADQAARAAEWSQLQQELQDQLTAKQEKIQSQNDSIQKLEQQLQREKQINHQFKNDLEEAHSRHTELLEQIEAIQSGLAEAQAENKELQDLIRSKNEEIRTYHMEEQKLKRSLQAAETLQGELEQTIEKLKESIRQKEEVVHQKLEQVASFEERVKELQKEIENYLALIQQQRNTIDGLRDELEQTRVQVKNSRKEGHLMAEASRALSRQETFEEKIDYLKENVLRDIRLQRIIFYSLDEQENLIPTFSSPSFDFASTRLALSDTYFGQALASQRPTILNKVAGQEPYDLPGPESLRFLADDLSHFNAYEEMYNAARDAVETTIVLPLVLGSHTEGVLVLTTEENISLNAGDMALLEHLLPFVAAAYHDEKDRRTVQRLSAVTENLKTVRRFIEKRSSDLLLAQSDAIEDEDRQALSVRTHFVPYLLGHSGDALTDAAVQPFLENITALLKDTMLYPEFRVEPNHLAALLTDGDVPLFLWFLSEAVANAIEHSDGRRLLIESTENRGGIVLTIEDDGEGLIRKTGSMNPAGGQGFPFLQAAAQLLGLELRVTKGEGGLGTSLRLHRR